MKHLRWLCLPALLLTAALLLYHPAWPDDARLPGARSPERKLLRIWTLSSIGGGQAWLRQALHAYERAHPGVMTYLRQAAPEELTAPDAVLPDVVLYMPGDGVPRTCLQPLTGELPVDDALLRCGQYTGIQLGLPLCWGGYLLAINSRLEHGSATTPAPTTLLGKPAPTPEPLAATPTPGYPLEAALREEAPLQCTDCLALLNLHLLLGASRPALSDPIPDAGQVYARYAAGQCATAMLTTGQALALEGRITAGNAQPTRFLTPEIVITDQVWLASVTTAAQSGAAELLGYLIAPETQRLLAAQALQPAHRQLRLYAQSWPAAIAAAAQKRFAAVNAYLSAPLVSQICWQYAQAQLTLAQALDALQ